MASAAREFVGYEARSAHGSSARDYEIANAIAFARRQRTPMKRFILELSRDLNWNSVSRQMVYKWERQQARVPASVLLAAAALCGLSVDGLLASAQKSATYQE